MSHSLPSEEEVSVRGACAGAESNPRRQRRAFSEEVARTSALPQNKRCEGSRRVLLERDSYAVVHEWLAGVQNLAPQLRHWKEGDGEPVDVSQAEYDMLRGVVGSDGGAPVFATVVGGKCVVSSEVSFRIMLHNGVDSGRSAMTSFVSLDAARSLRDLYNEARQAVKWNKPGRLALMESGGYDVVPDVPDRLVADHFDGNRERHLIAKEETPEPSIAPAALRLTSSYYDLATQQAPVATAEQAAQGLHLLDLSNAIGGEHSYLKNIVGNDHGSYGGGSFNENFSGNYLGGGGFLPDNAGEYAFDVQPVKGIVGLKNLGNTCFMNAGVQCLAHLDAVRDFALNHQPPRLFSFAGETFVDRFATLVKQLWGTDAHVTPYDFKGSVDAWNLFRVNHQHDCSEFLTVVLDKLNEMTKTKPALPVVSDFSTCETAMRSYRHANDSFVTESFSFIMRSDLECPGCGTVSSSFDPSTSLSLNVPPPPPLEAEVFVIWKGRAHALRVDVAFSSTVADIHAQVCALFGEQRIVTAMKEGDTFHWKDDSDLAFDLQGQLYCYCLGEGTENQDVVVIHASLKPVGMASPALCGYPLVFTVPPAAPPSFVFDTERLTGRVLDHVRPWFRPRQNPVEEDKWNHFTQVVREVPLLMQSSWKGGGPSSPKRSRVSAFFERPEVPIRVQLIMPPRSESEMSEFWWSIRVGKVLVHSGDFEYRPELVELLPVVQDRPAQAPPPDMTLESCLKDFSAGETLSEKDLWNCKTCAKSTCAKKTVSVATCPNVLVVQLKRFDATNRKIATMVRFAADDQITVKGRAYTLRGVVNHIGNTIACGHYTAHVRIGDDWFNFNDHTVAQVNVNEVVTDNAYILFFQIVPEK
jgi:ubiquitin C-terminal hydrolase